VPADKEGITGWVAHTIEISRIQDGKEVKGDIVVVLKVGWVEKTRRRIVEMESFVTPLAGT
jgi:hypothetical protein